MAKAALAPRVARIFAHILLHIIDEAFGLSKRFQPFDQISICSPATGVAVTPHDWLGLGQGFLFGLQVQGEIFVSSVDARVSQPMGNHAQIDSRTQQVDRRAVAQAVRVKPL